MINTIKKEIINIISANVPEVQDLHDYNALNFRGFPAISVTLSENENEYATTAENDRVYAFKIRCFVSLGTNAGTITEDKFQRGERVMGDLVYSVIDALDRNYTLGNTVEWIEPAPSFWDYVNIGEGACLMAVINLRVHKYRDIT